MMKSFITIAAILLVTNIILGQEFSIARVNYGGGGDWYCDPSSIPNLLNYLTKNTLIKAAHGEYRIKLTAKELRGHPYLYMTGHGNVFFSEEEAINLRKYLLSGGFLHIDDNYGMAPYLKKELVKVFPDKELTEIPTSHPIFNETYKFPNGLPKIHEHDGKQPQALGIFDNNRLILLFTFESDLGDGWEDEEVHNDPREIRQKALKMGANIIQYAFEH